MSGKAIKRIDSELGELERRYKKSANAEERTIGEALGDAKATIRDYIGQQDPTGEINKLNVLNYKKCIKKPMRTKQKLLFNWPKQWH